jgi:hypothetical protein
VDADPHFAGGLGPRHQDLADEPGLESRRRDREHVVDRRDDPAGIRLENRLAESIHSR